MKHLSLVIRDGLLFGLIGAIFGVIVLLGAVYVGREFPLSSFSSLTGTVLSFLIFGSAGRKIAIQTRSATAAWQVGAIAGGVSELVRTVAVSIFLSFSPTGQAAFDRLSPAAQQSASDPASQIANLAIYLGAAIIFGGLAAWLGAWALLRFGPPSTPEP
ncbi:MAG TPA: hypothetical protein VIO62_05560 [Candidatus Dormibacteraeota bacterium]